MNALPRPLVLAALWGLAVGAGAGTAHADSRRFAWNYETTTAPAGTREYEQWVTWKTGRNDDPLYDRLEFRHELEFGLSDRVQLGVYLTDWRYTRAGGGSDTEVRGPAAEVIWNLADPYAAPLGVAAYGEVALAPEKLTLEAKLLLEKPLGAVTLVANTVLEAEWEDEDWVEDTGTFEQTLGASWELSPSLLLGAEGMIEKEFPDWGEGSDAVAWIGPSASVRLPALWITTAPLFLLGAHDDEPGLAWRTLAGFDF